MRIGILTLPPHGNYGGILQAYALQTVLERMGHNVIVFNKPIKKRRLPFPKFPLCYFKRIIQKYVLRKPNTYIFVEDNYFKYQKANTIYTDAFVNKHLHNVFIDSLDDIKNRYDAIIVGSDQVWRKIYFNGAWDTKKTEEAYLSFTNKWKIKRIAYAASFGIDGVELDDKEIHNCKRAIQKFDAISVREKSGVDICRSIFEMESKWLADPTLLLEIQDYLTLAKDESKTYMGDYILMYALDESDEIYRLAHNLEEEKNLSLKVLKTYEKMNMSNIDNCARRPVEEWLYAFANSSYVLTDSFHGTVFSILFHKQFTVIANKERGITRFISLLNMFGLSDRLIYSPSEYKQLPDIDYNNVEAILQQRRSEAFEFLRKALS